MQDDRFEITLGEIDEITQGITTLLAGLDGAVCEFDIFGISLQRVSDGAFRCILRGSWKEGSEAGVRLVGFTNAGSAAELLGHAERAFRDGLVRWKVDQYANGARSDGAPEVRQMTLLSDL